MKAILVIKDETNVKINGLDINMRKKLVNKFKFILPHARHMPAFKLGRWDGSIAFFQLGGSTFINLLPEIIPMIMNAGYEIDIDDLRTYRTDYTFEQIDNDTYNHVVWPKDHRLEGQPIVLQDHQVDTVNNFLNDTQSLQEVATGAGKTIVTASLSERCQKYGRTIVVVPNRSLVSQTEEDYINMGLDVGVIFGGRHEYDKTHTICTWQSLDSMLKKDKKGTSETTFAEFIVGTVAVIVDECHGMKADVLKAMMQGPLSHIPIRWGLTGTIPREVF